MIRSRLVQGVYPSWIEVKGFKSMRSPARIYIQPLTLLAGANSSGKSSVFQPLLLLKQSMELHYDPDPLLLNGPHVAFTSLNQFLSRSRTKAAQVNKFEIAFGPLVSPPKKSGSAPPRIDLKLTFNRTSAKSERLSVKTSIRQAETKKWIEVNEGSKRDILRLMDVPESDVELHIFEDQLFKDVRVWPSRGGKRSQTWPQLPIRTTLDWLRTILHLPGHRGHRERKYPITKVTRGRFTSASVVGPMHPYAASLLLDWKRLERDVGDKKVHTTTKKQATESLKQVNEGLKSLGLTWKVLSESVNAAELELRVGRLSKPQPRGAQDLVDIADVGFGISQVLPVLVGLAAATPGQMVLIEQPELHLHPRAQLAMGRVLAEAANRGVIVVVETHSQLILRAIQTIVAKGALTPDRVGLHWFTRDDSTGWSTVTRADLHKDGTFGDWPVDFPDIFSMADEQFIDAVFNAGDPA
jgi:predicted ATPase